MKMKTKTIKSLFPLILGVIFILSSCGAANSPDTTNIINNSAMNIAGTLDDAYSDVVEDQSVAPGTSNNSNVDQLEFWNVDEFETWMDLQREINQQLADNHEQSYYEKDTNGDYYPREWTQEDVDRLYAEWQEHLELMKQGYQFTKPFICDDGAWLAGAFLPEN